MIEKPVNGNEHTNTDWNPSVIDHPTQVLPEFYDLSFLEGDSKLEAWRRIGNVSDNNSAEFHDSRGVSDAGKKISDRSLAMNETVATKNHESDTRLAHKGATVGCVERTSSGTTSVKRVISQTEDTSLAGNARSGPPRWAAPIWALLTLLIVGSLLAFAFKGNFTREEGLRTIPIGEMDLGRRVKGENPLLDQIEQLPEPDPAISREVRFETTKPSGNRSWFKFIWSLDEIETAGASLGATVDFDMEELGIIGPARCTYIGPCPKFKEGDGNLVIGVFKHEPDGPVVNVHIEGLDRPIGSTANHPFWSEDRQDFVEAGALQPGEQVWSEQQGVVRVKSVTPAPDAQYVYNLTVHNQHVYEVSELGVLVHNTYRLKAMDPSTIRFTQSSVGNTIGTPNGTRPLRKLVKDLVGGRVSADDLPPIRVFKKNGQLFTLDNRRLKAFQVAGKPINTVPTTAKEITDEAWKFTTKNGGISVKVRGGGL